ncbi:IS701 family transposase [Actinoplanes sp. NPDC051494]|uniref:IS701 family transposase n=1 Tax=Actinoplanes sp. NPDC051494 TaxID=3363907 RepID=UPI00379C1F1C
MQPGIRRTALADREPVPPWPYRPAVASTSMVASVFNDLCDDLFVSLVRRDQRLRARQYLRGLLGTHGRKTIRNIAAFLGGAGTDQRLHHFISDSTWDWEPVRAALTRHVMRMTTPEAWVIRSVVIPKGGLQTVGVDRRFCRTRRKVVHAQEAIGVIAVSGRGSFPVSWRLRMSQQWIDDDLRRARSGVPDGVRAETLDEGGAQACRDVFGETGSGGTPVVLDGRALEHATQLSILRANVQTFVRIPPGLPLSVIGTETAGDRTGGPAPAREIAQAARSRRRPVLHLDGGVAIPHLVSSVDVRSPLEPGDRLPALRLMAINELGHDGDEELWLTAAPATPVSTALSVTKLLIRADRDLDVLSERVGIWDYSGRSFPGWHRHVTLASAAHAVEALTGTVAPPAMAGRWDRDGAYRTAGR